MWSLVTIITLLLALLAVTGASAQEAPEDPPDAGPQPGAIGEPPEPLATKHVYDMANLLDNREESKLESDAARLQRFGIPALIVIQASDMAPEQASSFAAEVRRQWGVESAPGANDGLVMMVIVDTTEEKDVFTIMSWGDEALPHFGIDEGVAESIHTQWLDTYVQDGQIYEGILYSLRRLIYHSIYDPAPAPPLTSAQETVQSMVSWSAPLLALGGIALAAVGWPRPKPSRRAESPTYDTLMTWGMPVAAIIVGALSVWSQSEWGVLSACVLTAVTVAGWVRRDPATQPPRPGVPGRATP